MFEKEIKELTALINEKIKSLGNIELNRIRNRNEIIKKYEKAIDSIKLDEKAMLVGATITSLIGVAIFNINKFDDNLSMGQLLLSSISFPPMMFLLCCAYFIDNYYKSKKIITKITKGKYGHLKANEENDKQVEESIINEYIKNKQELQDLKDTIAWFEKANEMKKYGYQVENKLTEKEHQEKLMYEQLWNEYLLSKIDYSQAPSASLEIDYEQKLVKKI